MKTSHALLTLCFMLCLGSVASALPAAAGSEIKIGVISGLSGIAARWGHYQNHGMELAQEELAGSERPVRLIFEDSQSVGAKAITALNKLVTYDKVDALLAGDFGFVTAPLIPLASQQKKFMLTISMPQESCCRQSKGYFFSITSQFVFSEAAFEKFFELHPEIKKAALFIFDDPEWGLAYAQIWERIAARRGVQIVNVYKSTEFLPDYKPALARSLALGAEVLLLAHEPVSFTKAVLATNYKGPILAANNYLEAVAAKEDLGRLQDQLYIVDPEISPEFVRRYKARFNEQPILEAYAGYEAVHAISRAFAANREHPELGIKTLKYQGVSGEIDFTGKSCTGNLTRWGLFKLKDMKLVQVGN